MIYIIPKFFDDNWERMIHYVSKLNELDIKYNSKKTIFPRLENTEKRGKSACQEILKLLNCYFKTKNYNEELIYCIKADFNILELNGKKILLTLYEDNKIFDIENYYFVPTLMEARNKIDEIVESNNLKSIFINPVEYFKTHLGNMDLNKSQKLELIKFILN